MYRCKGAGLSLVDLVAVSRQNDHVRLTGTVADLAKTETGVATCKPVAAT